MGLFIKTHIHDSAYFSPPFIYVFKIIDNSGNPVSGICLETEIENKPADAIAEDMKAFCILDSCSKRNGIVTCVKKKKMELNYVDIDPFFGFYFEMPWSEKCHFILKSKGKVLRKIDLKKFYNRKTTDSLIFKIRKESLGIMNDKLPVCTLTVKMKGIFRK
jgi:hypothetical protein